MKPLRRRSSPAPRIATPKTRVAAASAAVTPKPVVPVSAGQRAAVSAAARSAMPIVAQPKEALILGCAARYARLRAPDSAAAAADCARSSAERWAFTARISAWSRCFHCACSVAQAAWRACHSARSSADAPGPGAGGSVGSAETSRVGVRGTELSFSVGAVMAAVADERSSVGSVMADENSRVGADSSAERSRVGSGIAAVAGAVDAAEGAVASDGPAASDGAAVCVPAAGPAPYVGHADPPARPEFRVEYTAATMSPTIAASTASVQNARPMPAPHEGTSQIGVSIHQGPADHGSSASRAMTPMPTIAGSNSPSKRRCRWMRPLRSGRSAHAAAYRRRSGAPRRAATTMIPRTISGSMPMRWATPADTPPSQPSERTMPRLRIQSKKRVPRPAKPDRAPPYGVPGALVGGPEGGGVGESCCVICRSWPECTGVGMG